MFTRLLTLWIAGSMAGLGAVPEPILTTTVQLTTVALPYPLAPASTLPNAEELTRILNNLADPQVSDEVKSELVAGGMDRHRANVFNRKLREAGHRGALPLTFTVTNIQSTGPDTVRSDVTVIGPKIAAPITKTVGFTDENGWLLSQSDADELVDAIVGRLPN